MNTVKFFTLSALLALTLLGAAPTATAVPFKPKAELAVTSVRSRYAGFGDTWFMYYTVKNAGTANAGAFRITVINPYSGAIAQDFVTPGLVPGGTRTYRHTVSHCMFDRQIIVDSDNRVPEFIENNNRRTFTNLC